MSRRSAHTIIRDIHAFGAAAIATILILVSVTGAALVWKREYLWLTIEPARAGAELSLEQAARVYEEARNTYGDALLLTTFGHEDLALHKLYLSDRRYAYLSNNGGLLASWQAGERIEEQLYDFHHRLLLDTPGLWLVGASGLLMIILVPVGVVAWWPARRSFRVLLWQSGAWRLRREARMTHRNLGLVSALPLLVVLATGVILVFPEEAQHVLLKDGLTAPGIISDRAMVASTQRTEPTTVDILRLAQAQFPGSTIRSISQSARNGGSFSIALQRPEEFHPRGWNTVVIAASGEVVKLLDSQTLGTVEKAYKLVWPLHTARIDSVLYKVVLTLFGLGISGLALLGLVSFARRWQ